MRHRIGFNRLDRRAGQRKALLKNALTSLFIHERIKTTKAKALEIRRFAEKMITRAKDDTVHNRRVIGKVITNQAALAKIFTEIAPRYGKRPGGYTRILKLGQRRGDAAEMVLLELVESEVIEEKREQRKKRKAEKAEKKRLEEERLEKEAEEAAEEKAEDEAEVEEKVEEPEDTKEPEAEESSESDTEEKEESPAE